LGLRDLEEDEDNITREEHYDHQRASGKKKGIVGVGLKCGFIPLESTVTIRGLV